MPSGARLLLLPDHKKDLLVFFVVFVPPLVVFVLLELKVMGRTLPTFTDLVRSEQDRWARFRRALRKEDRDAFDALFAAARYHSAPGAYASDTLPFEAMVLAMLVEIEKRLDALEKRMGGGECKGVM